MITIPDKLKEHLRGNILTLALCWKISSKNGKIFAYTNYDQDLMIDNICYKNNANMSSNNLNSSTTTKNEQFRSYATINNTEITLSNIENGLLDDAYVEIFIVNYQNIGQGIIILKSGNISKIKIIDNKLLLEIRSLKSVLNTEISKPFSKHCRAEFGDTQCGINILDNQINITNFIFKKNNIIYSDQFKKYPDGYFEDFQCVYNNISYKIIGSYNGNIIFYEDIQQSNFGKLSLINGCDKKFTTCSNKFNNAINFRGEPHIPENLLLNS